ncbi:alpha/beta hydrolase [Waterburya agarophytonicola K14]|uniref:Alpha/beta hydrolase n=1 Tax=Waterburya agarophytonicola KI4 TaxID=2874699 RepID=A0A964BNN5_9CYAN|nr:alpha/beta hydrolase [Waterburya agarophytonicola]MCC0175487.1 alpha/beta hydrolase [Waterburya agarophytonicola KI4]
MNFDKSVEFIEPNKINRDAPLFVYLPGMDGTGELLQTQADKLASCFDLRCLSIRTDSYSTWQTLAKDTIELIQIELTRKTNKEVHLCGESFGGCLALKTALAAPSLFDRLILVNPASSFNQFPILGLGVGITPWLPTWLHRYSAAGLLPFLAKLNRINDCDRVKLVESMKSLPPQVVSWRLSLLRDFKVADEQLRSLNIPTLIIAGAEDSLLPSVEEADKLISLLPTACKTVLPQSGHACLLETEIDLYDILVQENFIQPNRIAVS